MLNGLMIGLLVAVVVVMLMSTMSVRWSYIAATSVACIVRPASNKVDFELFCLAVSAINACEMCMRSHEDVVIKGGLTEEQVHDAIRLAATIIAVQSLAVCISIAATGLALDVD